MFRYRAVTAIVTFCLIGLFITAFFFADPLRSLSNVYVAYMVGGCGALLILLSMYVLYLRFTGRERAEYIAKRLTRQLATERHHLFKLYDQSPVPYLTVLPNGTIHNPNMAAVRLYDTTMEQMEGKNFFEMLADENGNNVPQFFSRFRSGVPINREEVKVVRADGVMRWVMLSIFLFRPHGQRQQHGMATLVDITDQKELDQAKSEFVSLAGHQLRTPLSTVKWHTELLLSNKYGQLNEKQMEYIQKVRKGNQTMIDLVDMLLNISRIETGRLPVDIQEVTVRSVIEDVLEEVAPQVEQKNHTIEKKYTDDGAIKTDPKLLRIVVQNLCTNAIKYTPDGGTITITLTARDGKHALLVQDTGYGIPADQQDKIFGKMFRADNTRKKSIDGTGLGLYLVKSIVEKLGGTIGFTSTENVGTTFTVLLP